jgi:ubiquinone biosynthesis protein UbiJ
MGPWGLPFGSPYTREDEVAFLKDQAGALKDELDAIDKRLRDLESEEAPG